MDQGQIGLAGVQGEMARAAAIARRKVADVTLIAVSKGRSAAEIMPLIAAGQRDFGENRIAEARDKWAMLPRDAVRLHMIGQLQSNKAAEAVALFDVIHALDRRSLLDALVAAGEASGRWPGCYVQVNIGDEPQKGGVAIGDLPDLVARIRASPVPLLGLMAMPPLGVEAAPYFALAAELAWRNGLSGLSMGMSGDYAEAIMLGATAVRVGSALFG